MKDRFRLLEHFQAISVDFLFFYFPFPRFRKKGISLTVQSTSKKNMFVIILRVILITTKKIKRNSIRDSLKLIRILYIFFNKV